MNIRISAPIKKKLMERHKVTPDEVEECFLNRDGKALKDRRVEHQTTPPTYWFIAETNKKRKIKICTVIIDGVHHIKTAYEPNEIELKLYNSNAY